VKSTGCSHPRARRQRAGRRAGLLAQVRLRIGDQRLTAVITRDAVEELKLRRGDEAIAIVKSTEVMIARGSQV
jgi:molybdopterin-binding protein